MSGSVKSTKAILDSMKGNKELSMVRQGSQSGGNNNNSQKYKTKTQQKCSYCGTTHGFGKNCAR